MNNGKKAGSFSRHAEKKKGPSIADVQDAYSDWRRGAAEA
jgi:hypothetical protein